MKFFFLKLFFLKHYFRTKWQHSRSLNPSVTIGTWMSSLFKKVTIVRVEFSCSYSVLPFLKNNNKRTWHWSLIWNTTVIFSLASDLCICYFLLWQLFYHSQLRLMYFPGEAKGWLLFLSLINELFSIECSLSLTAQFIKSPSWNQSTIKT